MKHNNPEKAIKVQGLRKVYGKGPKAIRALDGVDLEVEYGTIFGLLGPNGAGKTTLISVLCNLIEPEGGQAWVCGYDIKTQGVQARKQLNVVSGFTGVLQSISCEDLLQYYCYLYEVKNSKQMITKVLKEVNLEKRRTQAAEDLSSGLRQRLLLAKALLNKPRVVLLDEPTVGLDVEAAIQIRQLIKKLRSQGYTILLTSHNMFEVEELCDKIALINNGKITDIGTVAELRKKIRGGKLVEVVTSDPRKLAGMLRTLAGVKKCANSGSSTKVMLSEKADVSKVLSIILKSKIKVYSLSVVEPTMEQIYLKLTSKDNNKDDYDG